jgi:tRNA-Thr(GGU) m(6)t(6)A37 methyltransferase TsaA
VTEIRYRPIGFVRSPFHHVSGMPLQSVAAREVVGTLEMLAEFAPGLLDLAGFSHLHVITHLHQARPGGLEVIPFLDDQPRGIFATRSPHHPNPIGLSVVELISVDQATLHIRGLDLLDGTPILDLKPYVPAFDRFAADRIGWFQGRTDRVHTVRADDRFSAA